MKVQDMYKLCKKRRNFLREIFQSDSSTQTVSAKSSKYAGGSIIYIFVYNTHKYKDLDVIS